jgi:hypothetical protein
MMFLIVAAGAIATFAPAASTQASYITTVTLINNTVIPVDGLDTTWAGVGGPITDVELFTPSGVTGVIGDDTVHLAFDESLIEGGIVTFSFMSQSAPIEFVDGDWLITLGGRSGTLEFDQSLDNLRFSTEAIVVPEPQAMSLMVLGLAGLLGLRRISRRSSAARA